MSFDRTWSAIAIFALAWKRQLEAHKIFAEIKKRKNNTVHAVPHGDWFQYVSCPHYLAEILMYLSLAIIVGTKHKTGWLIFTWVLINQVIAGLMSHRWYKKTFRN